LTEHVDRRGWKTLARSDLATAGEPYAPHRKRNPRPPPAHVRDQRRGDARRTFREGRFRSCERRAAFTDFAVVNARATSGSRTTTLAPRGILAAYLPRTPAEKSYSARISSPRRGLSFPARIASPLPPRRESSTDDADPPAAIGVRYDEQAALIRSSQEKESLLVDRVIGIEPRKRERIRESAGRLPERDSVLSDVQPGFVGIPLEHPSASEIPETVARQEPSGRATERPCALSASCRRPASAAG